MIISTAPSGVISAYAATVLTDNLGPGNGGSINIVAGQIILQNATNVLAQSSGSGFGGDVIVSVGGSLTVDSGASLGTIAFAGGNAGNVSITATGAVTIDMTIGALSSILQGIGSLTDGTGSAGSVTVSSRTLRLLNDGLVGSFTFGAGNTERVSVSATGQIVVDGTGGDPNAFFTGITSQSFRVSNRNSGNAGTVTVSAGSLSIVNNDVISSSTFGSGVGGSVSVKVAGQLVIDGTSQNPAFVTGIASQSSLGSTGNAGDTTVLAGTLSILNGGVISGSTFGPGNGGSVIVAAEGPVIVSDPGSRILASATSTASGDAGAVTVAAPQITIARGGQIASTTAGTGAAGSVTITTPGALVLDGAGISNTQIAASAIGPQSGPGGSVTVSASSLIVKGGAQIASSTAGPGKAAMSILPSLRTSCCPTPDRKSPHCRAAAVMRARSQSRRNRLLMQKGGAISTEAETSTASGGNITLHLRDFLYLVRSEITSSVKGETGNGGNIIIDPQLVILNHSGIRADAIEGHGGNILITAGAFIRSSDSVVEATGELGISGPRVDVSGALVVLPTELGSAAEVLRESCAARSSRTQSSLAEVGRGGLPQDPEATLPALYIADRELHPQPGKGTVEPSGSPLRTMARLTMRCR